MIAILNTEPTFNVIMQASNGQDLLTSIRAADELPEVILLDIRMPIMHGFLTATELIKNFPSIKIIVLSMHDEARHIIRMIELGANGYQLKNARPEEVIENIRYVVEDEFYFNNKINALMRKVIQYKGTPTQSLDIPVELTQRELEVLELICKEHTHNQ